MDLYAQAMLISGVGHQNNGNDLERTSLKLQGATDRVHLQDALHDVLGSGNWSFTDSLPTLMGLWGRKKFPRADSTALAIIQWQVRASGSISLGFVVRYQIPLKAVQHERSQAPRFLVQLAIKATRAPV